MYEHDKETEPIPYHTLDCTLCYCVYKEIKDNDTSVCKMILFSLLSIILIFCLMIGIYTFVMMKILMNLIL